MRCFLFVMFACLGLSVAPTAPAFAQPLPACQPLAQAIETMRGHPMVENFHIATPAEAKTAVDIINAMPPETNETFTVVVFVTAKNGDGGVLLGNDGNICVVVPFPARTWQTFLRSVRGRGV